MNRSNDKYTLQILICIFTTFVANVTYAQYRSGNLMDYKHRFVCLPIQEHVLFPEFLEGNSVAQIENKNANHHAENLTANNENIKLQNFSIPVNKTVDLESDDSSIRFSSKSNGVSYKTKMDKYTGKRINDKRIYIDKNGDKYIVGANAKKEFIK